jgi:hypothetical protein
MTDKPPVGFITIVQMGVAHTVSKYNFTRLAPFTQRGANFPDGIIRMRRTSLVISPDVIEGIGHLYDDPNGNERVKLSFGIDKKNKAIQLHADQAGFTVQVRKNSAGYLNTTRIDFGLPIGDYKLVVGADTWVFELAK